MQSLSLPDSPSNCKHLNPLLHKPASLTLFALTLFATGAESEFALWLEAIANGGSYQQLAAALTAAAAELNELRDTTVDLVAQFFR